MYLYGDGNPVNRIDPTGDQATIGEVAIEAALVITLAVLTTLAVLANSHAKGRLELPFRANHYTTWAVLVLILKSDEINNPNGANYFTTDYYVFSSTAKEKLAMKTQPQVGINLWLYKDADNLTGPNVVERANGEPGGGEEYYTDFPVPVSSREPAIFPLIN